MSSLKIPGSTRTPTIDFDFATGQFSMSGESYPEDVRAFYDEPVRQFTSWLRSTDTPVSFDFRLVYFNSSSARVLIGLIDQIEEAALDGRTCHIRWHHGADDDNIRELGEEFGSDLAATRFVLVVDN